MFSKQVALIIDQDKMSAQTIMRILKDDLGFKKVIITVNGKSALDELRAREIHWVIGEWDVPGITGAKLLKELRGNPKTTEVPFLMLSGSVDRDALTEAISLGVTDFIAKPFTPAIISSKIKRLSRIYEKRIAPRVYPMGDFRVEVGLDENICMEGLVVNISSTGVLISAPRLEHGSMNIFDDVKLKIRASDEISILSISSLVRMECDYESKYEMGTRILCAFDFKKINDENRVLLNSFISEQRGQALAKVLLN